MSEDATSQPPVPPETPDLTSLAALAPIAAQTWPLEPPPWNNPLDIFRDGAVKLVDGLLVRVARSRGALDVAIGDGLASLAVGDRVLRLGYSRVGDYALQRLGIAASTAEKMARLARALRDRPRLRAAVWSGELSARKAEAVVPVALGDAEEGWVERARKETVRALEKAVADEGGAPPEEPEWQRVAMAASPQIQDVWNEALDLAGKIIGPGAPRWQCVEAVCAEFLADHPEPQGGVRGDLGANGYPLICWPGMPDGMRAERLSGLDRTGTFSFAALKVHAEKEWREWQALERAEVVPAPEVPGADDPHADPFLLDEELRRFAALRARWDDVFGHLAFLMRWLGLWRDRHFATFGQYCTERLGVAERTVGQRIALERRLYELPTLRTALREGRVSYEQARIVARKATERTAEEWIARATSTTVVALRRELDKTEKAQMCAEGRLRVRLPAWVATVFEAALLAAQANANRPLEPEECLLALALHFISTSEPYRNERRNRVRERDGGWCQVPGCSRPGEHAHHVQFRSQGGGDEDANMISTCPPHHLHSIHRGWVRVTGRAPDALRWELGVRWGNPPLEVWPRA